MMDFDQDLFTHAYSESMRLTPLERRKELYDLYVACGFEFSEDKKRLTGTRSLEVSLEVSLGRLAQRMKNTFPVAYLSVKRHLAKGRVNLR